ncbi:MAG TPA: MotA/TolQ/ExbB proton channel family protein [Pirellulales bacterium]|nr:MotA/TolQ/ExbB proton channel family protein [Pirellulales bacterium]
MYKLIANIFAFFKSSLFWGSLASVGFFVLIERHILPASDLLIRYTTREWVQKVETVFFFVGMAELLLKVFDIAEQKARLFKHSLLGDRPAGPVPATEARALADYMAALPARQQQGYYPRRLREAFEIVCRKGSAATLEDELKYLADLDQSRSHAGFAFMRIVIWAIPIWGFLGTVLGITGAIASLNPAQMETSLSQVTSNLGGVFDTTALALMLSISLMFAQYFVDRYEAKLLGDIDLLIAGEMTGRFESGGASDDPHMAIFQQTAQAMMQSAEQLVDRRIEAALGKALARNVEEHAERLAAVDAASAKSNRRHWKRVHRQLLECTRALQSQSDVLLQVVQAVGQVTKLEDALNHNLASLAGAQHFQETQMNLLAAVHLLNARLGDVAPAKPQVSLQHHAIGHAA